MASVTFAQTFTRVIRVLSRDTGKPEEDIHAADSMENDLGYDAAGLRALSTDLNSEFEAEDLALTGDDTGDAETVNDVVQTTWENIPPHHKLSV